MHDELAQQLWDTAEWFDEWRDNPDGTHTAQQVCLGVGSAAWVVSELMARGHDPWLEDASGLMLGAWLVGVSRLPSECPDL